jgi:hypothetical protein
MSEGSQNSEEQSRKLLTLTLAVEERFIRRSDDSGVDEKRTGTQLHIH